MHGGLSLLPRLASMPSTSTLSNSLDLLPKELAETLPRLRQQDGLGDRAIVHVHLFGPAGDWWILESDPDGREAFGYVRFSGMADCAELGSIWIPEIQELVHSRFLGQQDLRFLIERDLHWTPRTLAEVKRGLA